MIKRIELINFMSHARTVIEPAKGLTVLIGPNNCGKSAVVTALQILAHNANSTYVRRHHEKNCEINVETEDGHVIQWARAKNGSPKYVIDGQQYDRLKGNTPEVLDQVLRLPVVASDKDEFDIHFGQQRDPVFLLNESGKASAQFFASSSDAIRLVEMQSRHKSKVSQSKRDVKRLQSESERLVDSTEILAPVIPLDQQLAECESNYDVLVEQTENARRLDDLLHRLAENRITLDYQQSRSHTYSNLASPPKLESTAALTRLTDDLRRNSQDLREMVHVASTLANLTAPPPMAPAAELQRLIASLEQQLLTDRKSETMFAVLDVAAPPSLRNEDLLQSVIGELESALQRETSLVQRASLIDLVSQPPHINSLDELQSRIQALQRAESSVEKLDTKLECLDLQIERCTLELEEWADANPVCPTCGAATDRKRLLELNRGDCRHE